MLRMTRNKKRGFTLIELAIVLSIAGLLFVGLWRLLAGGNQQVRDQSAASEQSPAHIRDQRLFSAPPAPEAASTF